MRNDYEDGPYVSPEQERLWKTLDELSTKYQNEFEASRKKALSELLDESRSSDAKRKALNDFFLFRMNPDANPIQLSDGKTYTFSQRRKLAETLFEDKSFPYNDGYLVLNNLDPFFESITLEDVILAYHNYRLSNDDESLSHFAKLIGFYTKYALETDGVRINFPVSDGILSHVEAINHLNSIIGFVDKYLQNAYEKLDLFLKKFKLKNEERMDLSSKIDRDAAWSFGKKSPLDVRKSKLIEYLSRFGSFDDFYLPWLLDDLYKKAGIHTYINSEELSSFQWPSYADLLELAEKAYQEEKLKGYYSWKAYKHIIDGLNIIHEKNLINYFNEQIPVTEEDCLDAENNNIEVDTASAFDSIQMNIRLFFIIVMATEKIPEFLKEKDKNKWRKKVCRKLCDIFTDDDAFENITDEDEINQEKIISNESIINQKKADLYKTFLMEYELSSVESIMKNRPVLLDRARTIAPEDTAFIEENSEKLLNKLQEVVSSDSLSLLVKNLSSELRSGKRIMIPEKVIHTLATAELLFTKYATNEFSAQDFDYSSISALYYQAFENAYNELIWGEYANYLNNVLIIGGASYTSLLTRQHRVRNAGLFSSSDPGYGFLPPRESDWLYYSHFDGNTRITTVDATCMYKSFAIFIEANKANELPGFYDWLATKIGFVNRRTMVTNINFSSLLNRFRTDMSAAVGNRNNASHGGSEITMTQCSRDRDTVLSDLQRVRTTHLGLIQQLVGMLNFCSK